MIARRTFIKVASLAALAASTARFYVRESFAQPVPNSSGTEPAKVKAPPGEMHSPQLRSFDREDR